MTDAEPQRATSTATSDPIRVDGCTTMIEARNAETGEVVMEEAVETTCHRCGRGNWTTRLFVVCPNCHFIEFMDSQ